MELTDDEREKLIDLILTERQTVRDASDTLVARGILTARQAQDHFDPDVAFLDGILNKIKFR